MLTKFQDARRHSSSAKERRRHSPWGNMQGVPELRTGETIWSGGSCFRAKSYRARCCWQSVPHRNMPEISSDFQQMVSWRMFFFDSLLGLLGQRKVLQSSKLYWASSPALRTGEVPQALLKSIAVQILCVNKKAELGWKMYLCWQPRLCQHSSSLRWKYTFCNSQG